jgi:hypothetical protein
MKEELLVMTIIENPRYSRPLDVHRWSDHPEVKALVEEVWEGYLPKDITAKQKTVRGLVSV